MPRSPSILAYADNFNDGLRTDVSADKAPEGSLVIAENVRYVPSGGFYMRKGIEEVTAWTPGTGLAIEQFGKCMEHNVLFVKSGTKIFQTLGTTLPLYDINIQPLTTGERGQFVEYNSTMKYSNGTNDYTNITVGLVLTQFTAADTSIVLQAGHGDQFSDSTDSTVTLDGTTNKVAWATHGLLDGERVMLQVSGGALPAELSTSTIYYIVNKGANDFQISLTSGGAAIDFTGNGSGTITATTGIITCMGKNISYTALTDDTFSGCVIPTGTYTVGAVVTSCEPVTGAPLATVIESVFEKMMGAGVGTAQHVIYYTATANTTNPEYIDDWTANGADSELFGKYGKITAMRTLLNKMYVTKDLGIEAWTGLDASDVPIREPFDESYGVFNQDCLIRTGNKLMMLATTNRVKTIEPDTTGVNPEPVINPYFDLKIKGTLKKFNVSQTKARMGYNERDTLVRITYEREGLLETLMYNSDTSGFSIDNGYSPSCWIEWNGTMFMGDASDDKIWIAESGYTDGAVSAAMKAATPIHQVGGGRNKVHVGELFIAGLIKRQTTMKVYIYCDGTLHRQVDIQGTASYVNQTSFRPFGLDSCGYSPIGRSGGDPGESDGFDFSVPIGINLECRNVQVVFTCQGEGYGVQIDSYELVHGSGSDSSATQQDSI